MAAGPSHGQKGNILAAQQHSDTEDRVVPGQGMQFNLQFWGE